MLVALIIGLAALVLILILVVVFRKDEKPAYLKNLPRKRAPQSMPGKVEAKVRQLDTSDADRRAMLELYPGLREIAYSPVPAGVFPTGHQTIEGETLKAIKEKISAIKPIPANYVKLLNLLRDPHSSPTEITTIVSTNPVFSAKILQTVNSPFFGLGQKVTSLGRAITLLGYNNVRTLVFQDSLTNSIPGLRKDADAYVNIWIHSAIVSVCAGYLGRELFRFSEYDTATMGLLHDIGKYFIGSLEKISQPDSGLPEIIQEEQQYRINHAALGSLIANSWKLSDSVVHAIEYHHYPSFLLPDAIPERYLKESFVVSLSDLIARALASQGQEGQLLAIKEDYYTMFHLSPDLSGILSPALSKEIEKARVTVESYSKSA
jgi:HD-like signal output (HDOD) protein